MKRDKKRRALVAKAVITGSAGQCIEDLARYRPDKSECLIYLNIRAKSDEGSWDEDYALPVINGTNTQPQKRVLESLLKQARITKEQYDEAIEAVDALSHSADEKGHMKDRYYPKTMIS
jgi:hypothetical protein